MSPQRHERGGVDHRDPSAQLVAHEGGEAILREDDAARPGAGGYVRHDGQRPGVDGRDFAVLLGGHEDDLPVGPHGDPLGLPAHRHSPSDAARRHVERAHLGGLLVRDVERLAVRRQVERLGILSARQRRDDRARREIDDPHPVGAAIGRGQVGLVDARAAPRRARERHVEEPAVSRQLQAARPLAHRDPGHDRGRRRVDRHHVARGFVAHVDERARRGTAIATAGADECDHGDERERASFAGDALGRSFLVSPHVRARGYAARASEPEGATGPASQSERGSLPGRLAVTLSEAPGGEKGRASE